MPNWFRYNRDWPNLCEGLEDAGLSRQEVDGIFGGNWPRFYQDGVGPAV